MRARLAVLVVGAGVLLLNACGSEEAGEVTSVGAGSADDDTTTSVSGADDGSDSDDSADDSDNGEDQSDDGGASTTTDTTERADTGQDLAGDPFDIGPRQGERLEVVGVAHDDALNFREGPGVDNPIVDSVAPLSSSPAVISKGDGRLLPRSAWWHVTVGGQDAWANFSFLGMLGGTDDVLPQLNEQLGVIEGDDIDQLVEAIASVRGSDGPEPRITYVTDPDAGSGPREVVVDIIGYGDDALKGERFVLSLVDGGDSGDGVRLVGAEATLICGRGVSGDACV